MAILRRLLQCAAVLGAVIPVARKLWMPSLVAILLQERACQRPALAAAEVRNMPLSPPAPALTGGATVVEMGRPRVVPSFDNTGVAGMNRMTDGLLGVV